MRSSFPNWAALATAVAVCVSCGNAMAASLGLSDDDLTSQIRSLAAHAPAKIAAIYVLDAASTTPLFDLQGETPVIPASNNKVITTAAGLGILGPDYRFETRLCTKGKISDGTLSGDLIIVGGGDPTISGRFEEDKRDCTHDLRDWAAQLSAKGIKRIKGNIVADDSFFDDVYFHQNWYPKERGEWYEAEVSGLAFNDNCVDLAWSSKGMLPGDLAAFTKNPVTDYATFTNHVKVAAKGKSVERYYEREAESNDITATGTLAFDSTKNDSAAIHNGPLYAASVFRDVLTSAGIEVQGKAVQKRGAGSAKGIKVLVSHKSPPLLDVLKIINLNSQNFYAECLCKTLGKVKRDSGSFEEGTMVIADFQKASGIYREGHVAADGSGLSGRNHVTARQLAETFRFMDKSKYAAQWRETLPQGQTRGSLKVRFAETTETKRLAPRIYGKTGLIGGVRSLSGWITLPSKREFYYSVVLNGISGSNGDKAVQFIDQVALAIAGSEP